MFPNGRMKYRVTERTRKQITDLVLAGELDKAAELWTNAQMPYPEGTIIHANARKELFDYLLPQCKEAVAALADALDATLRDKHAEWFNELKKNNSESQKEA